MAGGGSALCRGAFPSRICVSIGQDDPDIHFLQIAAQLNLLVTGGSDYCGGNKPEIRLGAGWHENLCLPYGLLGCMKELAGRSKEKTAAEIRGRSCH
jgi:hypothetical protein